MLLPRITPITRLEVENQCKDENLVWGFVTEVFGKLVDTNTNLAGSIHLACTENAPKWGAGGIIVGCQISRTLEIQMVNLPIVTELATNEIHQKVAEGDFENYWRSCQKAFCFENPELETLVGTITHPYKKAYDPLSVAGIEHVAVMVYTLLKIQQRLNGMAFAS